MEETERYKAAKEYLGQLVTIQCTFQKYGIDNGTGKKTTCLGNLRVDGVEILDHVWMTNELLVNAKLRTKQKITIKAIFKARLRPTDSIYGGSIKDIQLSSKKLILLARGGKKCNV